MLDMDPLRHSNDLGVRKAQEADLPVVGVGSGTGAGDWRRVSPLTWLQPRATELLIYIGLTGIVLKEQFSWQYCKVLSWCVHRTGSRNRTVTHLFGTPLGPQRLFSAMIKSKSPLICTPTEITPCPVDVDVLRVSVSPGDIVSNRPFTENYRVVQ